MAVAIQKKPQGIVGEICAAQLLTKIKQETRSESTKGSGDAQIFGIVGRKVISVVKAQAGPTMAAPAHKVETKKFSNLDYK